jgi:long-chain acyl-CoA synthetase
METLHELLTGRTRRFEREILLQHGGKQFSRTYLSSLRLPICHSDPTGDGILAFCQERHDALMVGVSNRAEGNCLCCTNPCLGVRRSGSLGLPLPGPQCGVADADSCELPSGTAGKIVVSGPNVRKEYNIEPQKTRRLFRDRWLHTGGFGYSDSCIYSWRIADLEFEIKD